MKIRYIVLILVILGVGWFQNDQYQPNRNRENAEKVLLGMTSEEVLQLIGQPDKKKYSFSRKGGCRFHLSIPRSLCLFRRDLHLF